jgi:hypothetical protein
MKTSQPETSPPNVPAGVTPTRTLPPLRPPQPAHHERKAVAPAQDEAHGVDEPGYGHGV